MTRFKLTLEYDGRPFVGWQRQANGMSVQQALEEAVAKIDAPARVNGAGRTDAGVHATAQVAHVDLVKPWTGDRLREALNAHLRRWPVAVLEAQAAAPDFDARFSATKRRYVYRILARRAPPSFARGLVWHVARKLDAVAMHDAAQRLIGRHDFTTFRAAECQANSPVRTLERLDVSRRGEEIEVFAAARSFLHHQVRSLVGSLEHVGSGKWRADDLEAALDARDRARCGQVAPPDGLYLVGVDYDTAPRV